MTLPFSPTPNLHPCPPCPSVSPCSPLIPPLPGPFLHTQVLEKLRVEEPLLQSRIRALEEQRAHKQAALEVGRDAVWGREDKLTTEYPPFHVKGPGSSH